jgi:hypothetical protein
MIPNGRHSVSGKQLCVLAIGSTALHEEVETDRPQYTAILMNFTFGVGSHGSAKSHIGKEPTCTHGT